MKTASLVLAILLALGVANAEIIPVQVTATVTDIWDYGPNGGYFGANISIGDTLVMTYSYDTKTPDSDPRDNYAMYYQSAPNIMSIDVGGFTFQSNTDSLNYYLSLNQSTRNDIYYVRSDSNIFPISGYDVHFLMYWQVDYPVNTFENIDIPYDIPYLSNSYFDWGIRIDGYRDFSIAATPTSIELIPEPMTLLLFGLGGLIVSRKRNISSR